MTCAGVQVCLKFSSLIIILILELHRNNAFTSPLPIVYYRAILYLKYNWLLYCQGPHKQFLFSYKEKSSRMLGFMKLWCVRLEYALSTV